MSVSKDSPSPRVPDFYENEINQRVEQMKFLYPCYYDSYPVSQWVCSSEPMTKQDALNWLRQKNTHNYNITFKLKTKIPGRTQRFLSSLNPFKDTVYEK